MQVRVAAGYDSAAFHACFVHQFVWQQIYQRNRSHYRNHVRWQHLCAIERIIVSSYGYAHSAGEEEKETHITLAKFINRKLRFIPEYIVLIGPTSNVILRHFQRLLNYRPVYRFRAILKQIVRDERFEAHLHPDVRQRHRYHRLRRHLQNSPSASRRQI